MGASTLNLALAFTLKYHLNDGDITSNSRLEILVDMLIERGANDWNQYLDISTIQARFNWPYVYKFLNRADNLSEPCRNACYSNYFDLAKVLIQTGRVQYKSLEYMLLHFMTHNFNQEDADYIIKSSNAWDFQKIWSRVAEKSWSIAPLQYLQSLVNSINANCKSGKNIALDWKLAIHGAIQGNLYYRRDTIPFTIQQPFDGKIDERLCRFPQNRDLILYLAQEGVPLTILQEKIGGTHKFIKNLDHRKLLVSKYFKKYTRCTIPHVVQMLLSFITN